MYQANWYDDGRVVLVYIDSDDEYLDVPYSGIISAAGHQLIERIAALADYTIDFRYYNRYYDQENPITFQF